MNSLRRAFKGFTRILALLGLLTVLIIVTPAVSWWVRLYSGPLVEPKGDILVLLSAASDDRGSISYSSYWRARQAHLAWLHGGFSKIVVSGGGGPGIRDFLVAEGIPKDAIIAGWQAKSTRENAFEVARLTAGMSGGKVLLTSDFHIFRAVRVFRKLGIEVTPMPAPDLLNSTEHWNGRFAAFQTMTIESIKIVYYAVRGWI